MTKRVSYLTIQEWMLELDLRTLAEVAAYALIWGFSQDGASSFRGSAAYAAKWLKVSPDWATKILNELTERGLLKKVGSKRSGVPCIYQTSEESSEVGPKKVRRGSEESSEVGPKKVRRSTTLHNNSKKTIERDNAGACPLEEALSLSPFLSDKFKNIWKALVTSPGFSGKTYNQLMATSLKLRKVPEEEAFKMCLNAIEVGASYVRKFKS